MKKLCLSSILLLLVLVNGNSQVLDAWVLGDGEKVFRNDDAHPDRNGNSTWDGKTIRLRGLYNDKARAELLDLLVK